MPKHPFHQSGRRPDYGIPLAALRGWWDASAGVTDDGGGLVSSWVDRVGGLALTAAGAARPLIAPVVDRAALQFDGTGTVLAAASTGSLPVGNEPGEVWAVVAQGAAPADTGARVAFGYGNASIASGARSLQRVVTGGINRARISDATVNFTDGLGDFSGLAVLAGRWEDGFQYGRLNGRAFQPRASTTAVNTATSLTRLGAHSAGGGPSFYWSGHILHVVVTGRLLDDQRGALERWLLREAGL